MRDDGLQALDELVITHTGFNEAQRNGLAEAAGRALRFVEVGAAGYYQAKNLGFAATTAEVVAFGDADCWPESGWLSRLLAPVVEGRVEVCAGRTTYRPDLLGTAATTIDFLYFESPGGQRETRNFYANNVAFRRATFGRYATGDSFYRGHCQVLGLQLKRDGVRIAFEPRARTLHRFPDSARELLQLRLMRGSDAVALTPHLFEEFPFLRVAGPLAPAAVLAARLGFSVAALGKQDMPELRGLERLACLSAIAALSLADAAGAALRLPRTALSYHADVDGLVEARS